MPLPLLAAGALSGVIGQVLRYVFLAHLGGFVFRLFAVLGLSYATNELAVEPLLQAISGNMAGVPGTLAQWLDFFGFDNVISILASGYTMLAVKQVFLAKR